MESAYLPEILGMLLKKDEAHLLIALPGTTVEIASRIGAEHSSTAEALDGLYKRGFVLRKGTADGTVYALVNDLLGFLLHDKHIFDRLASKHLKNRLLDLCDNMFEKELSQDAKWSQQAVPQVRVIPVEKTISMRWGEVLPLESVSAILDSARTIAQTECTCRIMSRNCDNPTDVCILFDDFAEIFLGRGVGRRISKEEALDILDRSERLGLVHHLNNADSSGFEFLCNCCTCCCVVLRGMVLLGKDDICYKSRFAPKLDGAKCTGCGVCIERCQFGAIVLEEEEAIVDECKCFGCGLCASGCPEQAITLICIREPDHITRNLYESPDDPVEDLMIMRRPS
ncbi:MAG: 4Fe-4S binding protein [Thermoplasmata archaeon]|nr:4Fe-4S binding protein [Thermoplasmata archaeon]